jgi:hypothetical protein
MNIKVYVILIIALLGTVNPLISYSGIIPPDRPSHTKENEITDSNKLFKELENYESYRPDSFSDASRNPFGDKKYKNLKFTTEN